MPGERRRRHSDFLPGAAGWVFALTAVWLVSRNAKMETFGSLRLADLGLLSSPFDRGAGIWPPSMVSPFLERPISSPVACSRRSFSAYWADSFLALGAIVMLSL